MFRMLFEKAQSSHWLVFDEDFPPKQKVEVGP
jgi:hypothetical protein